MRVAAVGLVASLGLGLAVPASADLLDDQRQQITSQLDAVNSAVGESSLALEEALARLNTSQGELAAAETALAQTREKVAAAHAEDDRLAASLRTAQDELAVAEAAVAAGEKAIADQRDMIGGIVREQYQRQHNLMGVAVLVGTGSSAGLQTRIQLSTTMLDTNEAQLERLNELQRTLEAAKAAKVEAEARVATEKAAAAQVLASLQGLEAAEVQQQSALAAAVSANQVAQQTAAQQVEADRQAYEQLSSERERVNAEIAARDEAARQAAAAQAEAERAGREADAAKAAASAAGSTASSGTVSSAAKSDSSSAKSNTRTSSAGLAMPLDSVRLTSQYGMRVHPVTGVYKLHDGLDFAAGCGVPIKAVANGTVTQRYYNAGYGNRLFIDHGTVGSKRTTTSYNHLSSYAVSVGQTVKQGQVIGYVGTTGYSTGCHLHFMVWSNGQLVNPASVLP